MNRIRVYEASSKDGNDGRPSRAASGGGDKKDREVRQDVELCAAFCEIHAVGAVGHFHTLRIAEGGQAAVDKTGVHVHCFGNQISTKSTATFAAVPKPGACHTYGQPAVLGSLLWIHGEDNGLLVEEVGDGLTARGSNLRDHREWNFSYLARRRGAPNVVRGDDVRIDTRAAELAPQVWPCVQVVAEDGDDGTPQRRARTRQQLCDARTGKRSEGRRGRVGENAIDGDLHGHRLCLR
eukprot:scaffold172_cov254-Pinguiococcus_pyrenoidosus.AAC.29